MDDLFSKVRRIATIIFLGLTALGLVISFGLAFFVGPVISSEQYGKCLNTFALIYCPMAFVYLLLMLFGRLFAALGQTFGNIGKLGRKNEVIAYSTSIEIKHGVEAFIEVEFTESENGSRKTGEFITIDPEIICQFQNYGCCPVTYELDDFGNVTYVKPVRPTPGGLKFVGICFAILFVIGIIFGTIVFWIFYSQVIVEWLK